MTVAWWRRLARAVWEGLRKADYRPLVVWGLCLGTVTAAEQFPVRGATGALVAFPPELAWWLIQYKWHIGLVVAVFTAVPVAKSVGAAIRRRGSVAGIVLAAATAMPACGGGTGPGVGAEFGDVADLDMSEVDQGTDSVAMADAGWAAAWEGVLTPGLPDLDVGSTPRDECLYGEDMCQAGERCVDLPQGYRCDPPPGESVPVAPVDPCEEDQGGCGDHASCSVVDGAAVCACLPGFEGDGTACEWAVRSLDVDEYHACAVALDGSLWCWGRNERGVLGVGEAQSGEVLGPTRVGDHDDWEQVVVSQTRTFAVRDGQLYAFGDNASGRLGLGERTGLVWESERVGDADDWHGLSAGLGHTCGLRGEHGAGSLYCWGSLGQQETVLSPAEVTGRHWRLVRTSGLHVCGIDAEGALFCWGRGNGEGALGLGDEVLWETVDEPTEVGEQRDWTHLSVGTHTSCGIRRGQLWCWGLVTADPDAAFANYFEPTRIGVEDDWTAITVPRGTDSAGCGVRSGELWCWGANALGQAGDPSTGTPRQRAALQRLGAGDDWVTVASGREVTCAVRQSGEVQCWGSNEHGRFGGIGAYPPAVLEPTQVGTESDWTAVSAGWEATCGLRAGTLYCWGRRGDLGTLSATPAALDGDGPWSSVEVGYRGMAVGVQDGRALSWGDGRPPGESATLDGEPNVELAVMSRGRPREFWRYLVRCVLRGTELSCTGSNAAGELGLGDTDRRHEWEAVPGQWKQVALGAGHSCGVSNAGQLYCWGHRRAVGLEAEQDVLEPTLLDERGDWTDLSANSFNTCGLRSGQLWCWKHSAPYRMGDRDDWTAVSTSRAGGCGIAGDALYCWGSNLGGELNVPGVVSSPEPALLDGGSQWLAVSAGRRHACAVRDDQTLWCWGGNVAGETGTGPSWSHEPQIVVPGDNHRAGAGA